MLTQTTTYLRDIPIFLSASIIYPVYLLVHGSHVTLCLIHVPHEKGVVEVLCMKFAPFIPTYNTRQNMRIVGGMFRLN